MTEWVSLPDAETVAHAAASRIAAAAADAIGRQGRFSLVLAGGTTPLAAYRELAGQTHDWEKWHLYYGDERCLPAQDPGRNSQMVAATGLSACVSHEYVIPAELGPELAAQAYTRILADALPFDLVLLGMGEDGHTASLFPGEPDREGLVLPVRGAPKPPAERVSLNRQTLQACHRMLVLVTGSGKREAVQRWRAGDELPVGRVADVAQSEILVESSLGDVAAAN